MDPQAILQLGQLGAAGLIGVLWVMERRHAALRDRQLDEAHRRLLERERDVTLLLEVIRDNTRAIAALEGGQRHLIDLLRAVSRESQESRTGGRFAYAHPHEEPGSRTSA
ncbi:MAG: hypothetical protein HRU76_05940 [Phycisphaeraceae bacterium]|nr:MAG: hypothetical protein HRU76_05940 [Phycisphaeraceae bacterium]